jgi:ABC-type antimicrobial peptide transport system permease subunit
MATVALRRNILRSALTTLGIVIGIAAVIAMVEIGQGASRAVQKTIQSMGSNILLVFPGASTNTGVRSSSGTSTKLTLNDADAILKDDRCTGVRDVAPIVRARAQVLNPENGKNSNPWNLYGTTPKFLTIRDWDTLAEGEPFTSADDDRAEAVCVVGQTIVRDLYEGHSPLGKPIRINGIPFKIIGVLERKGANMMGMDQDDIVLAPLRTIKFKVSGTSANAALASIKGDPTAVLPNTTSKPYPTTDPKVLPDVTVTQATNNPQMSRTMNLDQILIQATSNEEMNNMMDQVRDVLRERHHLRAEEDDDFIMRDMAEISKALGSTANLMGVLLLLVATISLIVGGVGIMNIMLVSVTERTREIGLRMAVGARSRDIMKQFLVESALLCFIGGIFGVLLGRFLSFLVWYFMHWAVVISWPAILGAVGVSLVVGVVFGFYPAYKASQLDPIEALRYE